jgi:predicted nucleic acid-binding protein
MTRVVDASVVVAALIDSGSHGQWAESELLAGPLAAPHLMPAEVANILRRAVGSRSISADVGAIAHSELLQLRVALFPYEPMASRVWELRATVTAYDAWYVALAEQLAAPLSTLDRKLTRASGPRCAFRLPSSPIKRSPRP